MQKQKTNLHMSRYREFSELKKLKAKQSKKRPQDAKAITTSHWWAMPGQSVSNGYLGKTAPPLPRPILLLSTMFCNMECLHGHSGSAILAVSSTKILPTSCPLPGRQKEKQRSPGCRANTPQEQLEQLCAINAGLDIHPKQSTRKMLRNRS